ncbi:Integrase/recombinase, N-terminal [Phytophthora cactorum]|nr:Integrase/recombinase, N-terminal [Phytophthora cactorum]
MPALAVRLPHIADCGLMLLYRGHNPSPDGARNCQDVLHKLQAHALATGSHRKYESSWRQWTSWCRSEGLSPWLTGELAQDSEQLIKFAMWCWWPRPGSRGNSASTVVSKLSHISWYHRRYCDLSRPSRGHQVAMQRMQRLSAPPSRKRSITVDLLRPSRPL